MEQHRLRIRYYLRDLEDNVEGVLNEGIAENMEARRATGAIPRRPRQEAPSRIPIGQAIPARDENVVARAELNEINEDQRNTDKAVVESKREEIEDIKCEDPCQKLRDADRKLRDARDQLREIDRRSRLSERVGFDEKQFDLLSDKDGYLRKRQEKFRKSINPANWQTYRRIFREHEQNIRDHQGAIRNFKDHQKLCEKSKKLDAEYKRRERNWKY